MRSCYRYLADPGFRRDLETLRERQLSAVVDALRAAGTRAVERLRAGLDSRDEKVAIRAADRLLTHLLAGWEARELERRLAALETAHEYRMAEGQGERA
ncbi:MAG: hypothetical protein D6731_18755 [Planctomycetota bacterium]|nr:MAG: hypothetical protein D6731_18755 [Planctomycetota bacterium]